MTVVKGFDSAYAPSLQTAQIAVRAGVVFWGCYLYGSNALNIWTVGEVQVLREAGLLPLPICVPRQNFSEDPEKVAAGFVAACQAAGIVSGGIVLDVEHGAPGTWENWAMRWSQAVMDAGFDHAYRSDVYDGPRDPVDAAVWTPLYTLMPPVPSPGQAIQWGQGTFNGTEVDFDVADEGFPLGSWTIPDPPPTTTTDPTSTTTTTPTTPTPTSIQESDPMTPCVFNTSDHNQQAFFIDGTGLMHHKWWNAGAKTWTDETLNPGWVPSTNLTYAENSDGVAQVWGMMADGAVGQVYWTGTSWVTEVVG